MTANKAALKNSKFILFNLQVSLAQLFHKEQGNQIYTQTHRYIYTDTHKQIQAKIKISPRCLLNIFYFQDILKTS